MSNDEIMNRIKQILVEEFEVDPARLQPHATLRESLGLDSLDAVDLVVSIERKFGCRIQEDSLKEMRTLGDISRYVEQYVATAGAKGAQPRNAVAEAPSTI